VLPFPTLEEENTEANFQILIPAQQYNLSISLGQPLILWVNQPIGVQYSGYVAAAITQPGPPCVLIYKPRGGRLYYHNRHEGRPQARELHSKVRGPSRRR
jgi:hypothetical protein